MQLHRLADLVRKEPLNRVGDAIRNTLEKEEVTNIESLVALIITAVLTCSRHKEGEFLLDKKNFLILCDGMWEAYGKALDEKEKNGL